MEPHGGCVGVSLVARLALLGSRLRALRRACERLTDGSFASAAPLAESLEDELSRRPTATEGRWCQQRCTAPLVDRSALQPNTVDSESPLLLCARTLTSFFFPVSECSSHTHSLDPLFPSPAVMSVAPAMPADRSAFYATLRAGVAEQLSSAPHSDPFALCANVAALIYHSFCASFGASGTAVNWAGFYLLRNIAADESNVAPDAEAGSAPPTQALVLGPFHGQPAVTVIRVGRGVCGAAVAQRATQLVPDVHAHPDHIACDSASQSELVVPLFAAAAAGADAAAPPRLVGVLDLDSPVLGFFGPVDATAFEEIAKMLADRADWTCIEPTISVKLPGQQKREANCRPA